MNWRFLTTWTVKWDFVCISLSLDVARTNVVTVSLPHIGAEDLLEFQSSGHHVQKREADRNSAYAEFLACFCDTRS